MKSSLLIVLDALTSFGGLALRVQSKANVTLNTEKVVQSNVQCSVCPQLVPQNYQMVERKSQWMLLISFHSLLTL